MINLIEGALNWCWLGKDSRIRDYRQEFLEYGPAQSYVRRSAEGFGHNVKCGLVRGQIGAMRVHQDICVEGDHLSIAISRISAHDIDAAVDVNPPVP
jgi:hypothetical protein